MFWYSIESSQFSSHVSIFSDFFKNGKLRSSIHIYQMELIFYGSTWFFILNFLNGSDHLCSVQSEPRMPSIRMVGLLPSVSIEFSLCKSHTPTFLQFSTLIMLCLVRFSTLSSCMEWWLKLKSSAWEWLQFKTYQWEVIVWSVSIRFAQLLGSFFKFPC